MAVVRRQRVATLIQFLLSLWYLSFIWRWLLSESSRRILEKSDNTLPIPIKIIKMHSNTDVSTIYTRIKAWKFAENIWVSFPYNYSFTFVYTFYVYKVHCNSLLLNVTRMARQSKLIFVVNYAHKILMFLKNILQKYFTHILKNILPIKRIAIHHNWARSIGTTTGLECPKFGLTRDLYTMPFYYFI